MPSPASNELFTRGRILVTGATGLFGRELVDRLLALGASLRTVSILPPPPDFPADRVEHLTGDLADQSFARQVTKGMSGLFHLAGRAVRWASSASRAPRCWARTS